LEGETLSSKWTHLPNRTETFFWHAPTLPIKGEVRTYRPSRDGDGHPWWEIVVTNVPLSDVVRLQSYIQEKWSIADSATGHQEWYQKKVNGQTRFVYTETLPPGGDEVACALKQADDKPIEWQVRVDDTYGCEPVLLLAGAKVARDPQARAAIFSTTDTFIQRPSYWTMTPLGERKLPNPESQRLAPAVCLIQDHDPTPMTLYYDEADTLLAVAFDNIYWIERTEPSK